jgi:hypothetical protein
MQSLESKNLETHIKKYHFNEIEKDTISEKDLSYALDTSSITTSSNSFGIVIHVNNQLSKISKISKNFKEKIMGQKRLLSSSKLSERSSHDHPSVKIHTEIQSTEKLVCDTCKKEMDEEICRIVITSNVDGGPQFFSFHFFAPCWDFEDFCQKNNNLALDRMLFNIPENMSMSENSIKELQTNLSFWN